MIYEMRTYDFKPGTMSEVERRFGEGYEKTRRRFSELAACWHTEIGPLNQLVHIWPYEDIEERESVRAAAAKSGSWPPDIANFRLAIHSALMVPLDICPPIKPGRIGPYFEMRIYRYALGELPLLIKSWERAIETRLEFGPVYGLWYTRTGELNQFVQVWPYESLGQRAEIREKVRATGMWPPSVNAKREGGRAYKLISQESKILMPSAFSPVQ
ncbi:MAG TPA: NIPSNAP family protein [Burkholderiales bacterium]|nr:NIPSNAP family protein [Burkholderiales bacterium]